MWKHMWICDQNHSTNRLKIVVETQEFPGNFEALDQRFEHVDPLL